jgi:hypothetical protein
VCWLAWGVRAFRRPRRRGGSGRSRGSGGCGRGPAAASTENRTNPSAPGPARAAADAEGDQGQPDRGVARLASRHAVESCGRDCRVVVVERRAGRAEGARGFYSCAAARWANPRGDLGGAGRASGSAAPAATPGCPSRRRVAPCLCPCRASSPGGGLWLTLPSRPPPLGDC